MTLLPRTLFGRNLLLMVGLILLAQLVSALVFVSQVQRPRVERFADYAQLHIETLRQALQRLPEAQRPGYLAVINSQPNTRLLAEPDRPELGTAPPSRLARQFERLLRQHLGADYELAWQREPARWLWLSTRVDGQRYWIGLSAEGMLTGGSGLLPAVLVGATLLALLGAYLIQRRINAPLAALAEAARALGQGRQPQPVPDDGAQEIAEVAARFNQMAASLAATEQERAIMLAGISHDLRTPLTKLRLGLELLGPVREPELVESMAASIDAANHIIDQFIDFARAGSGEPLQAANLNALAEEAILSVALPEEVLHTQLGMLPPLHCQPTSLVRLISNLLQNASKYGKAPIQLSTTLESGQIVLRISDAGPGIPAAELERMQQPFTRADAARAQQTGAGLGLAIVRRVAEQHGARLAFQQVAGVGFEVSVRFPVQPAY
ncbi:ATP-binding protein [Chitinimonas sp.]|uniref:ATP-binding protein n=1 Tax=Chitinimonas sp. TaxID=1934313 RepID=UPI002F93EAE5